MTKQGSKTRFVSTAEVAKRIGVSPVTIWRAVHTGKMAAQFTPGGHARIPESEVARFESFIRPQKGKGR